MNKLYLIHSLNRILKKYSFRGKYRFNLFLKRIMPEMEDNLIVKTKYGFKLKISPVFDKGIERSIFNKGTYEEGTLWCFKKILKNQDIVIDAGANIGLTTIYASKIVGIKGKVFAIEPMPSTFDMLRYNIDLNKLTNVELINYAVGNYEGKVKIFENLHINRGAASIYSDNDSSGIEIPITTFDNIITKYLINKVDFIKIDIEGSEYLMLKGGTNFFKSSKKPIICIEFSKSVKSAHSTDLTYDFLVNFCHYRIFKQIGGKETQTPLIEIRSKKELPSHDNVFCFQEYHLNVLKNDLFLKNNL